MRGRRLVLFAVVAGVVAITGMAYDVLESAANLFAEIEIDANDPL